jgi:hypothetical protein
MGTRRFGLKCEVSDGVIPGEYAVQTSTADGQAISFFVSGECVEPERGILQVEILEESPDVLLVFLPVPSFELSSRTAAVSRDRVVELTDQR